MEIPVINRISDFETGISSLNNPSFLSQVYALSGIEKIYQTYSFRKWGALILALVASLSTIINKLRILIIRFRRYHSLPSQPLLYVTGSDNDTDSSSSSSDDEREYESPSTSECWRQVDEDFRVRGSGHFIDDQSQNSNFTLRKRRSSIGDLICWAEELTSGKSVVKLWDNLGLGFSFDLDESDNVLNLMESQKSEEKIAAVNADGVEKVYIKDDVTGKLTVGDMRKMSSPLRSLTESDVDTWWDADAVFVLEESVDE
ncbi:hypothetical protein CRYUN_Cryun21dG0084200 [Craigia yunnanensis]